MKKLMSAVLATSAVLLTSASAFAAGPAPSGADGRGAIKPQKTHFDLQAHRGGIGMTTEETPEGFAKALELGVTTLELDTQVTKDLKVVVTHDRQVSKNKCQDTAPLVPGDPMYPYVGKYIKDLTLAQIQTMNCGFQQLPNYPQQEVVWGVKIAELKDIFAVVEAYKAKGVMMNIETKVEAGAPDQTAPREVFVTQVYREIAAAGMEDQVSIQSFDWGALNVMHRLAPELPLVALTNYNFLEIGKPGASPWLGGIDVDDFGGDFVRAAASIEGVTTLSPNYGFPQGGTVSQPDFRFYPDEAMIRDAHARGLKVVPWTCNDRATLEQLIDLGVDGVISDYPNLVRDIMSERGMRLPKSYKLKG